MPPDPRSRERRALGIINRFLMQSDEARERLEAQKNAPEQALSVAAKAHYANTLAADDAKPYRFDEAVTQHAPRGDEDLVAGGEPRGVVQGHADRSNRQDLLCCCPAGWAWQPSRLKGIQVSPEHGTPFLAATQVFDVRPVPRKWLSLNRTNDHVQRFVHEGTILLTCSGSVGRAILADKSIADILISHDLLRIDVQDHRLRGWVYAYLRSPTIRAMMTSAQYGHMIKHLEVGHLDALPFIEIPNAALQEFTLLTDDVVRSRDRAHDLVHEAEERFGKEIGAVPDLTDGTSGFTTTAAEIFGNGRRFEGHYHNPVARAAEQALTQSGHRLEKLSNLVDRVFIPGRFKHVYGPDGRPYLDSAQILEVSPDINKKVLSLDAERRAGYLVDAGTLLLPCSGQLHGIIGSVVLAGDWHEDKVNRPLFAGDPEVRILGYGKEQMWKQIFT